MLDDRLASLSSCRQLARIGGLLLLLGCGTGPSDSAPAARGLAVAERPYVPRGLRPKLFFDHGLGYAPLDIDDQALHLTMDVAAQSARGVSRLRFHQPVPSRPVFLLDGIVTAISLSGRSVPFRGHLGDPDHQNQFYAIEEDLPAGDPQDLEVRYELPRGTVRFGDGGVGLLTGMSDLNPATYFEHWGPAGLEEDQFPLTLRLTVVGATSPHLLFSNGEGGMREDGEWSVQFPPHFTSSSFYVHLTNRPLAVRRALHPGIERDIPLVTYSQSASLADAAIAALPALLQELETSYGAYEHAHFVAYVMDGGGGMEHAGATVTSMRALGHELTHSWFARGVLPADGRAQWIDEGIATWRDGGYKQATALLAGSPTNLADYSPFLRGMPYVVHGDAARLMSEWDLLFQPQGGLRPLLRTLFMRYQRRAVTTAEFRAFLEGETGASLEAYFRRYVTGEAPRWPLFRGAVEEPAMHPLPPTEAELQLLQ